MGEKPHKTGHLFIVGTPLGNLEDITLRALRTLKEVDIIAAEDTRVSRKLLFHYEISTTLVSFHQHSTRAHLERLIAEMVAGKDVALITDAGMPGISDPGETLVAATLETGIEVIPIPGPSAVITALAISGLPTTEFSFIGFLPRTGSSRRKALDTLARERRTLVLFEAPHRLADTLDDLLHSLGDRRVVIARELTKKFEDVKRGSLSDMRRFFLDNPPRGEFTLVVEGAASDSLESPAQVEDKLATSITTALTLIEQGMSLKDASREVAASTGIARRTIYTALVQRMQKE